MLAQILIIKDLWVCGPHALFYYTKICGNIQNDNHLPLMACKFISIYSLYLQQADKDGASRARLMRRIVKARKKRNMKKLILLFLLTGHVVLGSEFVSRSAWTRTR